MTLLSSEDSRYRQKTAVTSHVLMAVRQQSNRILQSLEYSKHAGYCYLHEDSIHVVCCIFQKIAVSVLLSKTEVAYCIVSSEDSSHTMCCYLQRTAVTFECVVILISSAEKNSLEWDYLNYFKKNPQTGHSHVVQPRTS